MKNRIIYEVYKWKLMNVFTYIFRRYFTLSTFKDLHSLVEINQFIEENELAFLYFTTPTCSVCHGLKPQIEEMLKQYPEIKKANIDASEVREAAGQFSVFAAPVLLLFVGGKEYIREARIVHTQQLNEKIARIYENVVG